MANDAWSPRAILRRAFRALARPADLLSAVAVAWFVLRLPATLQRSDVRTFLRDVDRRRDCRVPLDRVLRARGVVLRVLRRFDNCYARAFTLYRFLDVAPQRLELRLGIEPPRFAQDRLRGHAWIMLDGELLEGPEAAAIARSRELRVS